MFGRIDRYFLSQFLAVFGLFALVLTLLYWVNRAVRLFEQLIADGQNLSLFFLLSALSLPDVIRAVAPFAAFIAVLYVMNRLFSEGELFIAQSTGQSLLRLGRSAFAFGILITLGMGQLIHGIVPLAVGKLTQEQAALNDVVGSRLLREGIFHHPVEDATFYVREIGPSGELSGVFIADLRKPEQQLIYTAQEALLAGSETGPKLVMVNGILQLYDDETERLSTTRFDNLVVDLMQFTSQKSSVALRIETLTSWSLLTMAYNEQTANAPTREALLSELHQRNASALLALAFVALSYGVMAIRRFSRFGVWPQLLVAASALICLQVLYRLCEGAAQSNPSLWWLWYLPLVVSVVSSLLIVAVGTRPIFLKRSFESNVDPLP